MALQSSSLSSIYFVRGTGAASSSAHPHSPTSLSPAFRRARSGGSNSSSSTHGSFAKLSGPFANNVNRLNADSFARMFSANAKSTSTNTDSAAKSEKETPHASQPTRKVALSANGTLLVIDACVPVKLSLSAAFAVVLHGCREKDACSG